MIVIAFVVPACAGRPALSTRDACETRDERPLEAEDRLTQADLDALERARDLVCPGELVGRCLRGSPSRTPRDVRGEAAAIHEILPTLRFVRQRAEAHCSVLAAAHPDVAARSRCRVLALR